MIGDCDYYKREVLSEADCYKCKHGLCGYWNKKEEFGNLPEADRNAVLADVQSLKEEAKILSEVHPSKDARFFANSVYEFLSKYFSLNIIGGINESKSKKF